MVVIVLAIEVGKVFGVNGGRNLHSITGLGLINFGCRLVERRVLGLTRPEYSFGVDFVAFPASPVTD